jgi:excisionase family DNA binding protein
VVTGGANRADAAKVTPPARSAPVLALSVEEACQALGVSWDFWRANVEADVRIVRVGRRKLVPVASLEQWLDEHAEAIHG